MGISLKDVNILTGFVEICESFLYKTLNFL